MTRLFPRLVWIVLIIILPGHCLGEAKKLPVTVTRVMPLTKAVKLKSDGVEREYSFGHLETVTINGQAKPLAQLKEGMSGTLVIDPAIGKPEQLIVYSGVGVLPGAVGRPTPPSYRIAREAFEKREYVYCIHLYSQLIQGNDYFRGTAYYWRGICHERVGFFHEALNDFRMAARLKPDEPSYSNGVAWSLATSPFASTRDGRSAVANALHACERTGHTNLMYLDTLAAAYAEAGEFSKAVETQNQALKLVSDDQKKDFESRLLLYRERKAYRERIIKPGEVAFENMTTRAVEIVGRYIIDGEGRTIPTTGFWNLAPGKRILLAIDGKRLVAWRFVFNVITPEGKTEGWSTYASDFDKYGNLSVVVDSALLASHDAEVRARVAAARKKKPNRTLTSLDATIDRDARGKAMAKIVAAFVAHQVGKDLSAKEGAAYKFGSFLAKKGRDAAIQSALEDVFPELGSLYISAMKNFIVLYLDKELTPKKFAIETGRDGVIAYTKEQHPELLKAATVIDFLVDLLQFYGRE